MQKICHYIDFNIANMQKICKKYAKNMLNMQQKYAINMQLICRICISLCICIFCIYMHSPLCWCLRGGIAGPCSPSRSALRMILTEPPPTNYIYSGMFISRNKFSPETKVHEKNFPMRLHVPCNVPRHRAMYRATVKCTFIWTSDGRRCLRSWNEHPVLIWRVQFLKTF